MFMFVVVIWLTAVSHRRVTSVNRDAMPDAGASDAYSRPAQACGDLGECPDGAPPFAGKTRADPHRNLFVGFTFCCRFPDLVLFVPVPVLFIQI